MAGHFQLLKTDAATAARRGRLRTLHGAIETPIFMPVGTQGTVKALTPAQIKETGAQIILGNTYHLNLRPGSELVRDLGGLHKFMGWDGPILTDSGGFQAFSLAKLRDIRDDGIAFASHLDGAKVFLGPREVMTIQANLGSDIAMVIDECPPWPCTKEECQRAVDRSLRWAQQCKQIATDNGFLGAGHHVFAIAQGSTFDDLRREAAESLAALDFPGYAVGGVSVGEPEPEMIKQVAATTPFLPANKPRYTMGLGTPPQILKMIALGVDMFDCVHPTRVARNGAANPIKTTKTSVMGAINCLGLAKRVKARVFQASTSEVYGDPSVHPQPESYWGNVNPIGRRSCYDEGKRVAETLFFDYHRENKVDIRIVRIFNTYGPRMHPNDGRVVSNFIVQALKGENLTVYGDGTQTRSFCYVDDLLEGFVRLMNQDATVGPVNIGNPGEFTMLELAEQVLKLTKSKSKIVHQPLPADDPKQRRPDITLAKKYLKWEPKVPLAEGLKKTIAYFKTKV